MAFILVDSIIFHLKTLILHDQSPNNNRGRQVSILRKHFFGDVLLTIYSSEYLDLLLGREVATRYSSPLSKFPSMTRKS